MIDRINKHSDGVTSYDVFKSLALILMVIDHVGAFLLPDMEVLRVIGRLSAPIWFFLIGFARSRGDIVKLLVAGLIVHSVNIAIDGNWLHWDVLWVFAFARLTMDGAARFITMNRVYLVFICMLMFVGIAHSNIVFKYGTAGYSIILFGLFARRFYEAKFEASDASGGGKVEQARNLAVGFAFYSAFLYVAFTCVTMPSIVANSLYLYGFLAGAGAIWFLNTHFRPIVLGSEGGVNVTAQNAVVKIGKLCVQFMGRYTLEFYVLHWIVFRIIGAL